MNERMNEMEICKGRRTFCYSFLCVVYILGSTHCSLFHCFSWRENVETGLLRFCYFLSCEQSLRTTPASNLLERNIFEEDDSPVNEYDPTIEDSYGGRVSSLPVAKVYFY